MPTSQEYQNEYLRQQLLGQQDRDYGELKEKFLEQGIDSAVLSALNRAHSAAAISDPSRILDPESLQKLKESSPDDYAYIMGIYRQFLAKKAGMDK
jgi:hypothetical protein